MIASLSEGLVYAEALGIEPRVYLETINSALFQSPFYQAYGKIMLDPPEHPGGTIALGEKDIRLFREAAQIRRRENSARRPLRSEFSEGHRSRHER